MFRCFLSLLSFFEVVSKCALYLSLFVIILVFNECIFPFKKSQKWSGKFCFLLSLSYLFCNYLYLLHLRCKYIRKIGIYYWKCNVIKLRNKGNKKKVIVWHRSVFASQAIKLSLEKSNHRRNTLIASFKWETHGQILKD